MVAWHSKRRVVSNVKPGMETSSLSIFFREVDAIKLGVLYLCVLYTMSYHHRFTVHFQSAYVITL